MRIISGKFKGRVIRMPKGIRPTQNKVRKALFDILGNIEGLSFLELFAGSGAIGFEALSEGAKEAVLVESNSECIKTISQNIESLQLNACQLVRQDTQKAIEAFYKSRRVFDIIFLDPPYAKINAPRQYGVLNKKGSGFAAINVNASFSKKTLKILCAYDILAHNGFIVVQHFKKDNLPDAVGDLKLFRQARYADTILSFYRKVNPKSQI